MEEVANYPCEQKTPQINGDRKVSLRSSSQQSPGMSNVIGSSRESNPSSPVGDSNDQISPCSVIAIPCTTSLRTRIGSWFQHFHSKSDSGFLFGDFITFVVGDSNDRDSPCSVIAIPCTTSLRTRIGSWFQHFHSKSDSGFLFGDFITFVIAWYVILH